VRAVVVVVVVVRGCGDSKVCSREIATIRVGSHVDGSYCTKVSIMWSKCQYRGLHPAIRAMPDLSLIGVQTLTEANIAANVVPKKALRDECPAVYELSAVAKSI